MQAQTNSTIAKQLRSVAAAASAKAKPAPKAAPSKPAKAAPAAKATPVQAAPAYKLGKAFAPKAVGKYPQVENWTVVCATVPATKEQLVAAIKAAGLENAAGFVQARIRKGHVVPV